MADDNDVQIENFSLGRGESRELVFDCVNDEDGSDYDATQKVLECQFRSKPGSPNILATPPVVLIGSSKVVVHVRAIDTRHLPKTVRYDVKATHLHTGAVKFLVQGQITVGPTVTHG